MAILVLTQPILSVLWNEVISFRSSKKINWKRIGKNPLGFFDFTVFTFAIFRHTFIPSSVTLARKEETEKKNAKQKNKLLLQTICLCISRIQTTNQTLTEAYPEKARRLFVSPSSLWQIERERLNYSLLLLLCMVSAPRPWWGLS